MKSFRKTLMEAAAAILISNCAFIAKAQAPEEDELQGLDLSQHGEEGYDLDLDLTAAVHAK